MASVYQLKLSRSLVSLCRCLVCAALYSLFYKMQTDNTNDVARKGGALVGSPSSAVPTEWPLEGAAIKHLYRDKALSVDMTVSQGGVGSTALFRIKVKNTP
jgi:hypothetical protein